jgi:GNAT superfamily N-acetyltransferase
MSHPGPSRTHAYRIHRLPTSDPTLLAFLAGKFASLRLFALTVSPEAFGSTFAQEALYTSSTWISRLSRPGMNIFLAISYGPDTPESLQTVDRGDFVGAATMFGPVPKSEFELKESGAEEPGEDEVEGKWHMTAVYNAPGHRGKGVGARLIQGGIDFALEVDGESKKRTRVRVFLAPTNFVARNVYEKLGFKDAGKCTRVEAMKANGDQELIPEDGGASNPEFYWERGGVGMELYKS